MRCRLYQLHDVRPPIGVFDAVLTAKGLQALKAIPGSTGARPLRSIDQRVKTGGKEIAKEALKEALSYGSRLLLGGASSAMTSEVAGSPWGVVIRPIESVLSSCFAGVVRDVAS